MNRHTDRPEDTVASLTVWILVFLGLGTAILANQPPEHDGRWILVAAVAYFAAAVLLFRLLVRKKTQP